MEFKLGEDFALEMDTKPLGIVLNMVGKERYELSVEEVEQLSELGVRGCRRRR